MTRPRWVLNALSLAVIAGAAPGALMAEEEVGDGEGAASTCCEGRGKCILSSAGNFLIFYDHYAHDGQCPEGEGEGGGGSLE